MVIKPWGGWKMLNQKKLALEIFEEVRNQTKDSVIGVTRESFGVGEEQALKTLEMYAKKLNLEFDRDDYQNLWIWRKDEVSDLPPIIIGSHIDSVPQGGNYDGLAGIVAGILILHSLDKRNLKTKNPIKVLALRGEESAWYGKAYIGSSALLGVLAEIDLENKHRSEDKSLGQALKQVGANIDAIRAKKPLLLPSEIKAYLELHIEQGPVMVARNWPVAVVTGIRGNMRHNKIQCIGETGHSGAVPRWLRKDALLAVTELLTRLDEHWRVLLQMGMDLVMTVGVCSTPTQSHTVSVIPGQVDFSFEVRSQDNETLSQFYNLMRQECEAIEKSRGVQFQFDRKIVTGAAQMDDKLIGVLVDTAQKDSLLLEKIPSGAGHDAAIFSNNGIPSGMIFIRNNNGSHNPQEEMDIEDFMIGTNLMLDGILEYSNQLN